MNQSAGMSGLKWTAAAKIRNGRRRTRKGKTSPARWGGVKIPRWLACHRTDDDGELFRDM
jgi:hypothetical protein